MIQQAVFDSLLKSRERGLFNKFLYKLRALLVSLNGETTINYRFKDNYNIQLPLSHDFPLNLKMYPSYSLNLGVIASFVKKKYPQTSCIDVGANVGDSAIIIDNYAPMPTLCIEGNKKFIPMLEQNTKQVGGAQIAQYFVGEEEETVSIVNNIGTARLVSAESGIQVKTMSSILEMFPAFKQAKLFKVDTDGFDNKILRASENFLRQSKPVVFFEYDPKLLKLQNENPVAVFDLLHEAGYERLLLFSNYGGFMCEIDINEKIVIEDLTSYYAKEPAQYLDICAFHAEDKDMIKEIKQEFQ